MFGSRKIDFSLIIGAVAAECVDLVVNKFQKFWNNLGVVRAVGSRFDSNDLLIFCVDRNVNLDPGTALVLAMLKNLPLTLAVNL